MRQFGWRLTAHTGFGMGYAWRILIQETINVIDSSLFLLNMQTALINVFRENNYLYCC